MIARLFLLFTVVSIVELYLLVAIGGAIGFWPTLGMVMLTALVGATLARREGLKVLRAWQEAMAQGRMPEEGLTGALLVLVAGVLLMTPGVLTDVAGIALMIGPVRRWVARRLEGRFFGGLGASPLGTAGAASAANPFAGARGRPAGPFVGVPFGIPGAVRIESFQVNVQPTPAPRVRVVDHGPAPEAPSAPEVLEADVVVDRRGRIVHRSED